MPVHRETREYKPLLFDTTLRNPERIKKFIKVISKYETLVPKDVVIHLIVKDVIQNKLYKTNYTSRNRLLNEIFEDPDRNFTDKQLEDIIKYSPQSHQEGGFAKGWPSRFFTWFKFIRALGFVYFDVDKPIRVSDTGKMLLEAFETNNVFKENAVFRNAMARFHRSSPYIMAANKNRPFPLLIATILRLKELKNNPSEGIYRFEIPYFLCWKDSDVNALANYIIQQRARLGLSPSDESIYDNAKDILGITQEQENLYKISNIMREMPDEYIRKMRLTGMIALRGGGRYLDINNDYIDDAKYIRDNYLEFKSFASEEDYFEYAGGWDERLGKYEQQEEMDPDDYQAKFLNQVGLYELSDIRHEFLLLSRHNGNSSHPLFRLLDKSIRLEFLTALLIKKSYPNVDVYPNYPVDDEGVPTSTAGGNKPDISCKDGNMYINVEVTMLSSNQQNILETPPIISHLQETRRYCREAFAIFIAPRIHPQTDIYLRISPAALNDPDLKIVPNTIEQFSNNLERNNSLIAFKSV